MSKRKALFLIYDGMSLSEVALLADFLTAFQPYDASWQIDTVGSKEGRMVTTEESFQVLPNKKFDQIVFSNYEIIVLTGNINPYPIAEDKELIEFLRGLVNMPNRPLIGAISSAPMFLAKAEVLKGVKFTSGLFEETLNEFDFFEKENIVRQPIVFDEEKNILTAIGFASREFAVKAAQLLGFDLPDHAFSGARKAPPYTEEELTFYRSHQSES